MKSITKLQEDLWQHALTINDPFMFIQIPEGGS